MISTLIQIIGFASIANLLTDFFVSIDKEDKVPTKPFKCERCLTYWISIIPFMVMYGFTGILYAAISSMVAAFIFKITAV